MSGGYDRRDKRPAAGRRLPPRLAGCRRVLITIFKICIVHRIMIVCMCRGINDRQIGDAIRRGACSLEDITRRCQGAGGECGICRSDIATQLAECRPQPGA